MDWWDRLILRIAKKPKKKFYYIHDFSTKHFLCGGISKDYAKMMLQESYAEYDSENIMWIDEIEMDELIYVWGEAMSRD